MKRSIKWPGANFGTSSRLPKRKLSQGALPRGDKAVEEIGAVVRRIPVGWVATYGQVAAMAACRDVLASLAASFSTSTQRPKFRGTASSTPRARCPVACRAMVATSCSDACWRRKASDLTTRAAWIWNHAAGSIEQGAGLRSGHLVHMRGSEPRRRCHCRMRRCHGFSM